MARKLRVQYPDAIYHVMNRGDRREAIFVDDIDHRLSLKRWARRDLSGGQAPAWILASSNRLERALLAYALSR